MSRIEEAIGLLKALGLPDAQLNERSALTLLALAYIKPTTDWKAAKQPLLRTVDIMEFMRVEYNKDYKANSRETIRRQTLHQFEQARVVDRNPDDPTRPTNSGKNCYAITNAALQVIQAFGTKSFTAKVETFAKNQGSLRDAYARKRAVNAVPLQLPDGITVSLSPGDHNKLQAAIIEEMGPRFAPGAQVLYVGDTAAKHVVFEEKELYSVGIPITRHDKLPDVVLYCKKRKWLFLIEAVTSHGPVSEKRHAELESLFSKNEIGRIYVTAFLNRSEFRKYAADIAWETEVWIADNPGHMIHFNGHKFLGPY